MNTRKSWFRFKTESEFIEEFGNFWQGKVHTTWATNGKMDCFLGADIHYLHNIDCLKLWMDVMNRYCYNGWNISRDMIKPIDNENIK